MFYVFAVLGVWFYSGIVTKDAALSKLSNIENTTQDNQTDMDSLWFWQFIRNNYYYDNNMNTIYNTFIVLFELLIGNQSHVISKMYIVLSKTNFSYLYFYSFKFVAILIVQNVLISFILDIFIHKFTQMEKNDNNKKHKDNWSQRLQPAISFENWKYSRSNLIAKRNDSRSHFYQTIGSAKHINPDMSQWEKRWSQSELSSPLNSSENQ